MRKTVFATVVLISLVALNIACVMPIDAQYQGSITINADGSVSPSTAPIQVNGSIYTLTSDIDGSITVNRSNMTLDGNGQNLETNGLAVRGVSNVTVENLIVVGTFSGNRFGIELSHTSNATVANNTIVNVGSLLAMNGVLYAGIIVDYGNSNIITGNNVEKCMHGMYFHDTSYNLIVGNNITGSNPWGYGPAISFYDSSNNNTIYHNNFANNPSAKQAASSDSINTWDNGFPSGGNYWSNYLTRYPNATEIDNSGIGDTSYIIDTQNIDRYPLMETFNSTFFELQATPPKISIQSPTNQAYNEPSVPLNFSVTVAASVKVVNWMGYSLDGQQNVTITGNTTLTGLSSGQHNITVYANDTFGNMGTSETISFTTPEPFPVMPVTAASIAVIIIAAAGLLIYSKKHKH